MPAGGPGDDEITDIVRYGLPIFTPAIDLLIAEVVCLGGLDELPSEELSLIRWGKKPMPTNLQYELRTLREELVADRRTRGWDVDRLLEDARLRVGRPGPPDEA